MDRPRGIPTYRKHKKSGQAIVTLPDGLGRRRDILLGKYGTAASRHEYARVIGEWEASGRSLVHTQPANDLSVNEVLVAYWQFAQGYYRKNGKPSRQVPRIKASLKPVRELYGHTAAKDFSPLSLKAVRERFIQNGWCRRYVNAATGCVKRVFKWATAEGLTPPAVYHGLMAVEGLKHGRCQAPESKPVRPVADADVEATLPYLNRAIAAMVRLQRLSGMRPQEVTSMRPCDIDRSGRVWTYTPESHKTEHHGISRVIFLGPQAQAILEPFIQGRIPGLYCFSPREMMAEWYLSKRQARQSKVQPSQRDRSKKNPRKGAGDHYSVDSYRRAIDYAIDRYGLPPWHPNQLRHSMATDVRKQADLDSARVILGHTSAATSEIYAELDTAKAIDLMAKIG
jgi:integrase